MKATIICSFSNHICALESSEQKRFTPTFPNNSTTKSKITKQIKVHEKAVVANNSIELDNYDKMKSKPKNMKWEIFRILLTLIRSS